MGNRPFFYGGSCGLFGNARLLPANEILYTLQKEWLNNNQPKALAVIFDNNKNLLRIPLFSPVSGRQVAMELVLRMDEQQQYYPVNLQKDNLQSSINTSKLDSHHGRIVLVSSLAPWAPHFRVLAPSWEDFLTLI